MAGGSNNDFFAASVGMDRYGTSVVIGAPYKGRGFAYIFVKTSTWPSTETACISSSTGGAGLDFGTSVTFSGNGNKIIAGAPGFTSRQGQVFVFDKPVSGWATTTNNDPFVASDPTNSAYFGQAVMLSYDGNSAVVGANGTLSDTGSAYLFGSGNETASTVVSTTADTVNATDNVTSLREAITYAGTLGGANQTITFASNLTSAGNATITLSNATGYGPLFVNLTSTNLTIQGPTSGNSITVSGGNVTGIFHIKTPTTINNLSIIYGNGANLPEGGAIYKIMPRT
jgi:hypothetical protein